MTRIMTIVSGSARTGKTQLAINLALEYVRRGRQVGLYHEFEANSPIDDLLALRKPEFHQRRASDSRESVIRRGYQGVDIISSPSLLSDIPGPDVSRLPDAFSSLETQGCYDEVLIDTSSMSPHTVLACCLASGLVAIVITPDAESQAGAFALLRILQLNGYSGRLCLVINKVRYEVDATEIRQGFINELTQYLGLNVFNLGLMLDDEHVGLAQGAGQAFSSCFPDAEISACMLVIADNADELLPVGETGQQSFQDFWMAFSEIAGQPLRLPGNTLLEKQESTEQPVPATAQTQESNPETPVTLLQFDGELDELYAAFQSLPVPLNTLANDMLSLKERLSEAQDDCRAEDIERCLQRGLLQQAAIMLVKAIEPGESDLHHVRFNASLKNVQGMDAGWLCAGPYLKYEFILLDKGDAVMRMRALLSGLPASGRGAGTGEESIFEWLVPARNGCLNVIIDTQQGVRIQVWSMADRRSGRKVGNKRTAKKKSLPQSSGKTLH